VLRCLPARVRWLEARRRIICREIRGVRDDYMLSVCMGSGLFILNCYHYLLSCFSLSCVLPVHNCELVFLDLLPKLIIYHNKLLGCFEVPRFECAEGG
jgi:hypothetical protein